VNSDSENRQQEETVVAVTPKLRGADATPVVHGRNRPRVPLAVGIGVALLVVLTTVLFVLPRWVEQQVVSGPESVEPTAIEESLPEAPQVSAEELAALETQAEGLLADLLPQQAQLSALSVANWGGEDWLRYEELSRLGDDSFLADDFSAAVSIYAETIAAGTALLGRSDEIVATALAAGQQALAAGDGQLAIEQFDIVLRIETDHPQATAGRARAERLPEVLVLVQRGDELRQAQNLSAAADAYREALGIDPAWTAARRALTAVLASIDNSRFDTLMSSGFSALAEQDFQEAKDNFLGALVMRPDSRDASDGLIQAEQGLNLDQIALAEARALAFERRELWDRAIAQYEAALATDQSLAFANAGLARARARADLDVKLANFLENSNLLLSDAVLLDARQLAEQARTLLSPESPRLEAQLARLDELMLAASTPLAVQLTSDELTEVTVYRVGQLGAFTAKEIQVRPGTYTVVGSRNGYRDVRSTFTVLPGRQLVPISVICVEPI